METEVMAKDKTFNLRLDEADRERLDRLAAHYSAPAATVVRILIKEKDTALSALATDRFTLTEDHVTVLHVLSHGEPADTDEIARTLPHRVHNFGGCLNDLRREGYLEKRSGRYAQTPKAAAMWKPIPETKAPKKK